jgi:predicted RNA binding protein YcfA (HicA-like mRNA interferase family)
MMEILINEHDWKSADKTRRLAEIIKTLKNSGWEKFGHNGTIVLFKDMTENKASVELESLGINEVKAEVWEEELYCNNIF